MADRARELAAKVLRRIEAEQAYATLALGGELARHTTTAEERGLTTELTYGVLRHQSRLDRALTALAPRGLKLSPALHVVFRLAAYQLLFLDRVPAYAVVDDAVSAARRLGGGKMAGFANRLLRRLAAEGEPPLPARDDPAYLAVACSLPPWLVAALRDAVPAAELADAGDALQRPPPVWLRVRPRADADAIAAELGAGGRRVVASPLVPRALAVRGLGNLEELDAFQRGDVTVQDLGAQVVAHLAAPEPGQRILDACAGVGGKSTHLAELCGDAATIHAADLSQRKLDLLAGTVGRLGLRSIEARCVDLTRPDAALDPTYDLVAIDAPCSGFGVIRRHPEARWRPPPDRAGLAALQARLLDALAPRVRHGGALVYSLCTFSREEGPEQIARFLGRHPEFAIEPPPASAPWAPLADPLGQLWTWPHRHDADGFFAVRLRRA